MEILNTIFGSSGPRREKSAEIQAQLEVECQRNFSAQRARNEAVRELLAEVVDSVQWGRDEKADH